MPVYARGFGIKLLRYLILDQFLSRHLNQPVPRCYLQKQHGLMLFLTGVLYFGDLWQYRHHNLPWPRCYRPRLLLPPL
ncbi:hypothetical protein [Mucilaginibacter sp. SP1R1]|uniref:hypothetical protein n=1 Tax=Mucilaginibacter sp. SP1R1 TaxID=2723091 RepID=UPI003B005C65